MLTVIIYATDTKYLDKTIDGVIDMTPGLDKIIVCDDAGLGYSRPGVQVITSNKIGRAKAWNAAATSSQSEYLIFVKDKTKVSDDWTVPLLALLAENSQCLVSPVVHTLDLGLWMSESSRWRRFGWRWDLNLYDRVYTGRDDSPSISSYCIATTSLWFDAIGGFDDGMDAGSGEDIEISLRSWLLGGSCKVCDNSIISVALELDYSDKTVNNLARIAEVWFPAKAGHFYAARGLQPQDLDVGRLGNLSRLQNKQRRTFEWFLGMKQPELNGIYNLKGSAVGKTIAIVAPGPSLDVLNSALIQRHDIIIGIDYVAKLFQCDFVITDTTHVVAELKASYPEDRFLVPAALQDRPSGSYVPTSEVLPLALQFERGQSGAVPATLDPPLAEFDSLAISAVHFALFLSPSSITVFGLDNKIIGGKSHMSKIEHYDDGRLWPDSESTRRRFAFCEFGLDQLGRLAHVAGIPLFRMGHA